MVLEAAEEVGGVELVEDGDREGWESVVERLRRRKGLMRASLERLLEVLVDEEDEVVEERVAVLPEVALRDGP